MGQKAWQWQPLRCRSWLLAIAATSGRKQLADASRLDTVVAVEDRRSYCQTPQALAAPRRGGGGTYAVAGRRVGPMLHFTMKLLVQVLRRETGIC